MNARRKVLLITQGTLVQVYADRQTDVKHVVAPLMQGSAGEIAAELYIESRLPYPYRDFYFPGNLRIQCIAEPCSVLDLYWRDVDLSIVREAKRLRCDMEVVECRV